MSFSVETYEITKRKGNNNSDISQNILNRIEDLENNQMNIFNEYYCDFSDDKFIDLYKSTIINTAQGIIPKQYINKWFDNLNNDDIVDWDKSKFISMQNKALKLDSPTTAYGELYTLPIPLTKYKGFKFNANVNIPVHQTLEGKELFYKGNLWFVQGTDNYGRVWMFTANSYDEPKVSTVRLCIYNKDMTIYKETFIAGNNFFGTGVWYPLNGAANITFSEENICVLGLPCMNYTQNGVYCNAGLESANIQATTINVITLVDENGNASAKYIYNSGEHNTNNNSYTRLARVSNKCRIIVNKNRVIYYAPLNAYYKGGSNDSSPNQKNTIISLAPTNTTQGIDRVNLTMGENITQWKIIGDSDQYASSSGFWCNRYNTDFFNIGDSIYSFCTSNMSVNVASTFTNMFLVELKPSLTTNSLSIINSYQFDIASSCTTLMYGGANGIYYSKKYNYLYVFYNNTYSNSLYIYRYNVDWTSKTTANNNSNNYVSGNTIKLTNFKTASIRLKNTTYDSNFQKHFFDKLKVYENDDVLHLMYGENDAATTKRNLMYLCINHDMDVVGTETILYDPNDTNFDFVNFDMIQTEGVEKIIYTCGNKDNFSTSTAPNQNKMYSPSQMTLTKSSIKWYYANNKDLQWKAINPGDQVTLPDLADDIRLKAVLESATRSNSSPEIKSLSVETWDNDFGESRKSEYYSNRIASVENDGKAVITADYDLNDGVIDWFISFNGGITFAPTELGVEFAYTHISAPDFRIKAEMYVKDNASRLPVIRSYTVKSNHIVLHSDLEEIQINLMKTNFKIDTYTNASKNGLFKMSIDTFSDKNNIDDSKSDYLWYGTLGSVGGNYIQIKPELINNNVKTILLTTDESLDDSYPNSHINYFVSVDGGITFIPIVPDIKQQVTNTNSKSSNVIFKAVFYDNAKLSAWGWAWN